MPLALLAGCGDSGGPTTVDLPGTNSEAKNVIASSGCLGCHRIGANGNDGPGPELTHIGSRIPRAKIADVLVNPTAPMPSFKSMPAEKRAQLVDYLAQLK